MLWLLLYFLLGAIASLYVIFRYGFTDRCTPAIASFFVLICLTLWPLVLTYDYAIALWEEIEAILSGRRER